MNNNTGRVESLPRLEPYNGSDPDEPWYRSDRARLFAVVSGITLILGLLFTLLQPVVYRSSATVLMSAPTAIDAAISEADVQNVAIQRTILLGSEITGRLLRILEEEHVVDLSFADLRGLLLVEALPETNLVEMAAQGDHEEILPTVANAWIDVYLEIREEDIARSKNNTVQIVQDEIDGLAVKLEETRDALEQYREDNQILSVERQENEVMARLDGLNRALNTAIEEEVKAGANLETLREAIRHGEKVVPKSDTRSIAALENELQTLRAQMAELTKRYTMQYINKQPKYRAIPERIEELEVELAGAYSQGREVELAAAEQAYAAARQTAADLQQKLDDHKAGVAAFNRIYATHQALADDLARLEELNREAQARLVQVQVSRVEKYPQVSVIERPGFKAERIGPNYLMLLGGTLLAALGLGVFAVWLQGYLGHRKPQPAYVTLSGVHLYQPEGSEELAYAGQPENRLDPASAALLSEGSAGGETPEDATDDQSREGKPGREKPDDTNLP
jgi:uncharacterized protein involved in exopolysaccharide biosynthesis